MFVSEIIFTAKYFWDYFFLMQLTLGRNKINSQARTSYLISLVDSL